jgi:glyoxylase-like metal-dependent hydrolase (beta-lactamase superfamily II)
MAAVEHGSAASEITGLSDVVFSGVFMRPHPRERARPITLDVVRPGLIEITPDEGVKESWPSCTLIECPGFRVLVDLGHPKEDPEHLLSVLRLRGLEPGDIHAVLFTHLHPDHIGYKELFSHALFVFHEDERLAFYFKADRTLRLGGSALLELCPEGFRRPRGSEEWPALRALGRHVYVRHFPGHTPGSLAVFACVGGRVHALAGDIILSREYHEHAIPPGSSWKPELIPEQMRLIAAHADVVVPGHGAPFECRPPRTKATRLRVVDRPGTVLPSTEETC